MMQGGSSIKFSSIEDLAPSWPILASLRCVAFALARSPSNPTDALNTTLPDDDVVPMPNAFADRAFDTHPGAIQSLSPLIFCVDAPMNRRFLLTLRCRRVVAWLREQTDDAPETTPKSAVLSLAGFLRASGS
jgi:hypothetical protein